MEEKGKKGAAYEPSAEDVDVAAMPGINFSTFIFSLNSSALVHLGKLSAPGVKGKSVNLPLAKQTIDILGMLEEKTAGNLAEDEAKLLKNMLHDLRLMYVKLRDQGA
ncbi:MAG: DUF1844 domain-containing protein [Desulfobacterales bacterium]|nr:DUF1844 domain-containing protein [Desulfobacterales bacterium]